MAHPVLLVKKLSGHAILPKYATEGSAALDLYASEDCVLIPGKYVPVKTGIAAEAPLGHYIRIASRSGLTMSCGFTVGAGVVDSDYRGEICVLLTAIGMEGVTKLPDGIVMEMDTSAEHAGVITYHYKILRGTRIAQMIVEKYSHCEVREVENLTPVDSESAHAGFGSTGTK